MTRLNTHLTWFEGGHVRLPRQAPWLADYRKELEQFPKGNHDDQVDSTSQALAWAQQNQWSSPGLVLGRMTRISYELDRDPYFRGMPYGW